MRVEKERVEKECEQRREIRGVRIEECEKRKEECE